MTKPLETFGVPLEVQKNKLNEVLAPWPKPEKVKDAVELRGENPENFLELFENELASIKSSRNLKKLQDVIVIRNANEFKLKESPTQEEFYELLEDYRKFSTRTKEHLVGTEEIKERVWQKLEEIIEAAKEKFDELKKEGK